MNTFDNVNKPDVNDQLSKLFEGTPTETETLVELPSRGRFYPNKESTVLITPIKFEDEKQLASNLKNSSSNPLNLIISKCVKGLNFNSILLMDKMYLLLKIREISYGSEYPASITCPKCGTAHEVKIDLSKLAVNELPDDLQDPRIIKLPKLKKEVEVRFPRVSDEVYLRSESDIYTNLWRFVNKLNGISDPVFISKAIEKMHIMDTKVIINQVSRPDLGLNPHFIFDCGSCGKESDIAVPLNENFFLVT
tara:strand:- start:9027 stop:9776 length:750 start_codon:yes stop_codon:yes gene_type:complete